MPYIIVDAGRSKQSLALFSHINRLISLVIVALCCVGGVLAQDEPPRELLPDTPQVVTVSADGMVTRLYRAPQAQWVSIRTEALSDDPDNPLDTILIVRDDQHQTLAYVDDTPLIDEDGEVVWMSDAWLTALYLPDAGDYYVLVDTFHGVFVGEVRLTLTVIDPFDVRVHEDDGDTTTFDITLPPALTYQQNLTLEAGQTLTVSARDTSSRLDPMVWLTTPSGDIIATNDDHDSDDILLNRLDAHLTFSAEEATEFVVHVRDFMGRAGTMSINITLR